MSHQWRPHPQNCPYCSYPHFPFCPPPQNPPYPTPPPHPIPPPHHYSLHPPHPIPTPQSLKRTRPDEFDNQRRLKLVRDHGGGDSHGLPPPPHHRYETEFNGDVYDRVLGNHGYFPVPRQPPLPPSPPPPIPIEPLPLPPIRSPGPMVAHAYMSRGSSGFGVEEIQQHSFLRSDSSRVPAGFGIEGAQQHRHQHRPYMRSDSSRYPAGFSSEDAQQHRQPFLRNEPSRYSADFNVEEAQQNRQPYLHNEQSCFPAGYNIEEAHQQHQQTFLRSEPSRFPTGLSVEEAKGVTRVLNKQYGGDSQNIQPKQVPLEKARVVDAAELFKMPHKVTRPGHFVIVLRGLPGSGKSYLAKMLRDMEVENGGDAPRIHSMDEYFMTEVEKEVDENESTSLTRGKKKPVVKKIMEYCYEPEMEEAYRASMLKAFKKTLDDGAYTFVIVDDRNLRVADFAQFWATAKRSGYEVYVLEAPYKDPAGCAARNVHGFTQDDIQKMAGQWEETPPLYLQLDIKSLLRGDDLKESDIQEVDMDTEGDFDEEVPEVQEKERENIVAPYSGYNASDETPKDEKRWQAEVDHPTEAKGLGLSKWSEDLDGDGDAVDVKGKSNSLSGLIQVYNRKNKSVHWGDQGVTTGFSIAAAKKSNVSSLVIGPGSGYNLKSNPIPENDGTIGQHRAKSKGRSSFQDRLRAERESFKAVFDRRRQRIGGLGLEDE